MFFQNFLNKYIPNRQRRKICRVGGLDKNLIAKWERKENYPGTLSIIYLALALSKEFEYKYEKIVLEGIYSTSKDKGVDIEYESLHIETEIQAPSNFSSFFQTYMNEEMKKNIVEKGILSNYTLQSYMLNETNVAPKPNNLVKICKYISEEKQINRDILVLEALYSILN